jgi:hypothetical protein
MFAWRTLDPKDTAEVILILVQRLSRRGNRPPKVGFDGRGLALDRWDQARTFVRKVVSESRE